MSYLFKGLYMDFLVNKDTFIVDEQGMVSVESSGLWWWGNTVCGWFMKYVINRK